MKEQETLEQPALLQVKVSARLAKKRKMKSSSEDQHKNSYGMCEIEHEPGITLSEEPNTLVQLPQEKNMASVKMPTTIRNLKKMKDGPGSRSFLDCLELKPVKSDTSDSVNSNTDESTHRHDSALQSTHLEVAVTEKYHKSKRVRQKSKSTSKSSADIKNCKKTVRRSARRAAVAGSEVIETQDNTSDSIFVNKTIYISSESHCNDDTEMTTIERQDSDPGLCEAEQDYQSQCGSQNLCATQNSSETKEAQANSEHRTKGKAQVYIFRDVNKVAVSCSGLSEDDTTSVDLLGAVDLNRHGKKRRYDKLMKKLADGEKKLENNFKEVQQDDNETDKEDISLCVEKMKENLRVREKKKYEYLINYMRDQWRVDQKSFQDLLPQKVDVVKANIVKQLGASTEKVATEKRMRGRPKKVAIPGEKTKESPKLKKPPANQGKKSDGQKKKNNAATRGFPVKFPKSLLSDSNRSFNFGHQKCEKFRVGIVDKNGSQEIIELNSDTLKGKGSGKSADGAAVSITATTDKTEDPSLKDDISEIFHNAVHVVSTQNREQEPASLSAEASDSGMEQAVSPHLSSPPKDGGGSDGRESVASILGECPVDAWQKSPPTTITLPSIESLEKDYELVSLLPSCPPEIGSFQTDQFFIPQSTFDKDGKTSMIIVGPFCVVCDPKPRLLLVSPEKRRKGLTMILRKKIHSPSSTPPRDFRIKKDSRWIRPPEKVCSESEESCRGDLATITLDHNYMTPPELRDTVKRYSKAVAKHRANAKFISARVEDITHGEDNYVVTIRGANVLHQVKHLANPLQAPMYCNEDGMPIVYSLSQVMTSSLNKAQLIAQREEMILESQRTGNYTPIMFPLSVMGDVVMEVLIPPGGTEIMPRSRVSKQWLLAEELSQLDSTSCSSASHTESVDSNSDSQPFKFLHSTTPITIDCDPLSKDNDTAEVSEITAEEEKEEQIVVENEAAVDAGPRPGLPCCRMCLRLFPSDYVLFTHVRSSHPTSEIRDSVYLEELRARSRLACPVCCNPPVYLATPPKLRRHLRLHHGIEHYVAMCRICRAEFLDKQELDLHVELTHNTFSPRGLVSLLKRQQTGHFARGQRSLLTDCLSCNRCNIGFGDRASLLSHTLKVHPELNQFNICRLCDRVFDSGLALHKHLKKAHEQTHSGALKCPFCPAWLPNMELASVHRVTLHNGAVPVHCPFCGAGYQTLHPMYNHVRSQHLQTEAHICPECQTSFPTSRMLSEHVQKAHLMTPYIMKESIHNSNTTTYCCPFCTVSFMRTYDLAVHVINAHKDHLLPAQCHMCMQSFVSEVVMKIHMSGAHGIDIRQQDGTGDDSYEHFDEGESVTVVLEDVRGEMYTHNKALDPSTHGRGLMRRHMMDAQDILQSQEPGHYIQDLDDRDTETIVYLNDRNQVVNTGEMFGTCTSMEDVQLLGEASDDFNLHGVDYLETLTNDSIAVGADVVADVTMDDIANSRGVDRSQSTSHQDLLGMANQLEIDGVLYEFAASHDTSAHHLHVAGDMVAIDGSDVDNSSVRVSGDRITIDASDFAQILRQQVQ